MDIEDINKGCSCLKRREQIIGWLKNCGQISSQSDLLTLKKTAELLDIDIKEILWSIK